MENDNKRYYYITTNGITGAFIGYLYTLTQRLDIDFQDKSIDLTVFLGENPTGEIVAERIEGEWYYSDIC